MACPRKVDGSRVSSGGWAANADDARWQSFALRGDLVDQVGKPALEESDLGFGHRYSIGPIVGHAPAGQIMDWRPAGKGPGMTEKRLQLLRSGCGGSLTRARLILGHLREALQGGSGRKETASGLLAVDFAAVISSAAAAPRIMCLFKHGDDAELIGQGGQLDWTGRAVFMHGW